MQPGVWVKPRKPISKYPKTDQQKKVKVGGELIRVVCKGKKGTEFRQCRVEVLRCAFDEEQCKDPLLKNKKREILKQMS